MTNPTLVREVSSFLSLLNNLTRFATLIKNSKSAPELEYNLNIVDNEIMQLKTAKTSFIREKLQTIERNAPTTQQNKKYAVEQKVVSLHREASTLHNILNGLRNYSIAILQTRRSEVEVQRALLEELYVNLQYIERPIKVMLAIDTLPTYIEKAVKQSVQQGAQFNGYVKLDKRAISKLETIIQTTEKIITDARNKR